MDEMKNIARNLRLYRKLRGWTQDEFALRLSTTRQTLSRMEREGIKSVDMIMSLESATKIEYRAWKKALSIKDLKTLIHLTTNPRR